MTLLEKYIIARWCYAIGEDFIEDVDYRTLHEQMLEEYPDNEYVLRSWSDDPCPIELLNKLGLYDKYYREIKFEHKSESIRSINTEEEFVATFRGLNERTRVSFKIDGFNIQDNYYNKSVISAETRGRTGNSLNANVVTKITPQKIPIGGKIKVTGECVIPNTKWKIFQLETGNTSQRNSVSTALARELTEYLQFVAFNIQSDTDMINRDKYDVLKEYGFVTPMCMYVDNFEQLDRAVTLMGKRNKVYEFPTDGLVIENSKMQVALRIREWKEKVISSYVMSYGENTGSHINSMLVNIKPVEVNGAKRREVSVTNIQYILDSNLQIGSPIAFDIRSEATAVLNTTMTQRLQEEYRGRYGEYREKIDEIAVE